jgi:glycerophosphoryl diester phosphodiesterase
MKTRYFDLPVPRLYGHRGSSAHHPENTLPAFRAALKAGMPYLELDVWATRDGHIVIHHDENTLRLCGVNRRICDCTLAEVKELDAGYTFSSDDDVSFPYRGEGITIPTLDELFQACPDALFNVEIKQGTPPVEPLVLAAIRRANKEDAVLLAAEKDAVMQRLRPLCGEIPTSLSYGELVTFFGWLGEGCPSGYRPPGAALQIPESFGLKTLVSPPMLEAAHSLGLEVHVWTVNESADMERLLDWGVDGIMSDWPEVLAEAGRKHIR